MEERTFWRWLVVVGVGVACFRVAQDIHTSVPIQVAIVVVPLVLIRLGSAWRDRRRRRARWQMTYPVNEHGLRDE